MKYNKILEEINSLIHQRNALLGARPLQSIERVSLFAIDVDDPIWEDVGIEEKEIAPPWLCDKNMQKGIRLVLQLDRCEEEERRLHAERASMQE